MTPEFTKALGRMVGIDQWLVWRLTWNAEKNKFNKVPCAPDGQGGPIKGGDPSNWIDYETAVAAVKALRSALQPDAPINYAVGFWLTRSSNIFFLDLDNCLVGNQWTPMANDMAGTFPGAMMEFSSSGRGMHIFGTLHSELEHRNHCKAHSMELYTQDRGICFGLDRGVQGDANIDFTPQVEHVIATWFPVQPVDEHVGRAPEWRGPEDDDELLRRARSKVSAAAAFGQKTSFCQLMDGPVERSSEHDMALAAHLAWWTGRDVERIERLMRRSALVRPKWDERRPRGGTYLRMTILKACAGTKEVYVERQAGSRAIERLYGPAQVESHEQTESIAPPPIAVLEASNRVSDEQWASIEALLTQISACTSEQDMHNVVGPAIRVANVPQMLQDKVSQAFKRKLKGAFASDSTLSKIRLALFPPAIRGEQSVQMPDWARNFCWMQEADRFVNCENGQLLSILGFQAEFNRLMPLKDGGQRANAAEACLNQWNMPVVDQVGYKPDEGMFYEYMGRRYANLYNENSFPAPAAAYTPEGRQGIETFHQHMLDMCGRRPDVFNNLLYWYAHNVQFPGRKIYWAPMIKGCPGDGKTLSTEVLKAAMGRRNVGVTSNPTLTNSGGFTDWAVGYAVNVFEEIYLTGRPRYQLYNAMKDVLTNEEINVNPKGRKTYKTHNNTNHIANTNENDASPLSKDDRRWFVIFTPWDSLEDMWAYCGVTEQQMAVRFASIDYAMRQCPSEIRAWLLSIPIPASFAPKGTALMTPEKHRMMATGAEDIDGMAASLILEGGMGFTTNVVCSNYLTTAMCPRAGHDGLGAPKGSGVTHMLKRLGFSKLHQQFKWNGRNNTVWIKNGFSDDDHAIRLELDRTTTGGFT